jgi:hypothetical protein
LFFEEIAFSPWGRIMSLGRRSLIYPREQLKYIFSPGTIMSLGKMSLSCPEEQLNLLFPWRTIISLGRRSLNCPREQFKSFFFPGNNHVLGKKEFKLP